MTTSEKKESKLLSFLEGYFEATTEGALPWMGIGAIAGALAGAFYGWSILPPETTNLFQLLTAIVGLVVGAIGGAIAGFVAAQALVIGIVVVVIYYLGSWLLSS